MDVDKFSLEDIYEIMNIVCASARLRELTTPYARIRPNLHCILTGTIGVMKSTILYDLCEQLKTTPFTSLTQSAILGSFDKTTGEVFLPAVWEVRDNILPIDEFYVDRYSQGARNALNTLLAVLENPKFRKKVNYRCNDYSKSSKGLYCKMKNGVIDVKTRFSLVMTTMLKLHKYQQMIELEALKTRCLVIPYFPKREEIINNIQRTIDFKFQKYNVPKKFEVKPNKYQKILDLIKDFRVEPEHIIRTVGDLCRLYAIIGWREGMFIKILSMKQKIK
jgi:hypothetical protein